MASGTISGTTANIYTTSRITWTSTPNVDNNTSTVKATFALKKTSSEANKTAGTFTGNLIINGYSYSLSKHVELYNSQGWVTIGSATRVIQHNSDGTKSITLSATGRVGTTSLSSVTCSGTAKLDTIPRASTVTAQSGVLGSPIVISVTRQSTSFTHDVSYSFAGFTGTIVTGSTLSTISWTPDISMASGIPNASSGTCHITCTTKSGSTVIGTKTATCTLSVPDDSFPTITSDAVSLVSGSDNSVVNGWANGDDTFYLQSYSYANCTVDRSYATAKYGATIKSYQVQLNGVVSGSGDFSDDTATVKTPVLKSSGNQTITVSVIDTRGKSASVNVDINVTQYTQPSVVSVNAFRCSEDGTENDEGTYLSVLATISYSSVGGKNGASVNVNYKPASSTGYVTEPITAGQTSIIGSGGISPAVAYNVVINVSDALNSSSFDLAIAPASAAFHIANGGTKAAFFTYVQADQEDKSVNIPGKIIAESAEINGQPPLLGNDSGWIRPELTSDFSDYSSAQYARYRKIGNIVQVSGAVQPTVSIEGGIDSITMFTLPDGYRPSVNNTFICQGSGSAIWLLAISQDGVVTFSRYRNETGYINATTDAWLTFSATYFVD